MTGLKIEKKITKAELKKDEPIAERDDLLTGATYKIKPPISEHAFYITINNLNNRPYEIFINTKCPDSIAWLMTITRMISAVMRVEPDITFLISELKNIHDPKGSYFYKRLGHVPSLQAHIGIILEHHIKETTNE